jgi:hypothetical protein
MGTTMTPFILRGRKELPPESLPSADCVDRNRAKLSAYRLFRRCLEMFLAGVMIWSAAIAAVAHADDKTGLTSLLNRTLAIFVHDVASFLTNAETPDGSFHLVRWNESNIVVGLQITKGTSRHDVDPVVRRLIQTFGSVRKALKVCLYNGQVGDGPDDEVDDHTLMPCEPNETDIDLVIDLSSEADPSKYTAFLENVQATGNSYRMIWQRAISAVAHSPDTVFCGGSTLSDDTAVRIVRAGGVIRIPASTSPNHERIIDDCANLVSLDVLGAVRIANPDGRRASYSENLLQLLYSTEFNGGETREDVRAKLQSALSSNN